MNELNAKLDAARALVTEITAIMEDGELTYNKIDSQSRIRLEILVNKVNQLFSYMMESKLRMSSDQFKVPELDPKIEVVQAAVAELKLAIDDRKPWAFGRSIFLQIERVFDIYTTLLRLVIAMLRMEELKTEAEWDYYDDMR